jgi:tRNA-dihydrouridine synthase
MREFPTSFAIGKVKIAPATVLAPMAGVTDTVFRRFIRNLGWLRPDHDGVHQLARRQRVARRPQAHQDLGEVSRFRARRAPHFRAAYSVPIRR